MACNKEIPQLAEIAANPLPKVEELIDWLASFGADPDGGVTRLLYSSDWAAGQSAMAVLMEQAGLTVYYDDVGNLFGRLQGSEQTGSTILTGSHIDTVKCGGKYDGAYGIIASLLALARLRQMYGIPKHSLEVVSICEEEGSRFPLSFWGSGNITGRYLPDAVPDVQDSAGTSLAAAMTAAGFGQGAYRPSLRQDIAAYIELHIEQGGTLEREQKTIGLVKGIVGQKRFTVELQGEANHAGTTPMAWRQDALCAAAEMIVWLEAEAKKRGEPLVATVGNITAKPNTSNVIPGNVTFTVDTRHADQQQLDEFCQQFLQQFQRIAEQRAIRIAWQEWLNDPPVAMHSALVEQIEQICRQRQIDYRPIYSGAGHDAQIFQKVCPTAMIFVPSHKGISHSPMEYTPPEALTAGIEVLTDLLYSLAYEGEPG
ncbi:allantoate deiminase [Brevibacillus fulvus]|uniref:Allantoate deiminase n=1 Tax=Brevibacillus fulvus TaxID=1125967 RepID=A0A938XS50_9BACL|nr:allantoate deiminase [Brevibacillus fulvus]MBM7588922.1 allantoate deiminase [Brevibacillus fulvus]